jgi:peptide/nickel transport system substrate-binding protein
MKSPYWERRRAGKLNRRHLIAGAAGTAGAVLLAGCGSQRSASSSGASGSAGSVKNGGKFTEAVKDDSPSFDPSTRFVTTAQEVEFTQDRLVGWKTGPDVKYTDFVMIPRLADKWETPDAQTYTFHLHPGVTFANQPPVNGRALTADDVKWTLEYLSRTGSAASLKPAPSAAMFEGLDTVETPDASTVVVHFKEPFAPFLNTIGNEFCGILAREVGNLDGGYDKNILGTGPWQLDTSTSQPGIRYDFKKNQNYWRQGLPHIDQVSHIVIPDDSTANAAFQTKQADMIAYTGLTADLVAQIQKASPSAVVYSYIDPGGKHIYMNVSKPPLNDPRVRQAFNLAIDRDAMMQALAGGKGEWALSGSMPGLFTTEETKKLLPHDPAQAKQLISAAGYTNGVDMTVIYPGQKYGQDLISQWQLMQQQLKPVGINLILQNIDATEESNRKRTGDFQLEMSPKPLEGDLDEIVFTMFYSKSAGNYGRINDPNLDKLVLAQRREPDLTKRQDIWRQIVTAVTQGWWSADLYYTDSYQIWQPTLKNYFPNQGYRGRYLVESWEDK